MLNKPIRLIEGERERAERLLLRRNRTATDGGNIQISKKYKDIIAVLCLCLPSDSVGK